MRGVAPQNKLLNTIGAQIAVLPDGTLLDVYHFAKGRFDAPNASFIGLQRSTDGGKTWSKEIVISNNPVAPDVDPDTGFPLRTGGGTDLFGGLPDVAVDPGTGAVYVVWADGRFSAGAHNDVALSKSTNGGRSWSTPAKVNQSPPGVAAFTPSVDVLPDGTVGITYYDLRNNTSDPSTLPTDHFIVLSQNGGTTWQEARITPSSFDYTTAPDGPRGYFLGDYEGLANDGSAFKVLFVQTNSDLNNRTDVFGTTVTPSAPAQAARGPTIVRRTVADQARTLATPRSSNCSSSRRAAAAG